MPLNLLLDVLKPERLTHVVDIGASPIEGDPPYRDMMQRGLLQVTGFEPQTNALEWLRAHAGPNEQYLPYVVGDGGPATLHVCQYGGWTSLRQPSAQALAVFEEFQEQARVIETVPVQTRQLDELDMLDPFDMLKIDVQGAEIDVFRGARKRLRDAVLIQTEVSFIPLYENQPGLGEVDVMLRSLGFLPFCLPLVKLARIGPLRGDDGAKTMGLLEADLVYVRDFVDPLAMTDEQLKHLTLLAHICYTKYDLCGRTLTLLESRGAVPRGTHKAYFDLLREQAAAMQSTD